MRPSSDSGKSTIPNKPEQSGSEVWTYDEIAEGLQHLRAQAGNPSYASIVRLIAEARQLDGSSSSADRPARTTVYDCFRSGRARVNARLVGEIVAALTRDEELAGVWAERCATAQATVGLAEAPAAVTAAPSRPSVRYRAVVMTVGVGLNLALIWLFAGPPLGWLELPVFLDMIGTAICSIALGPWYGVVVGIATNLGEVAVVGPSSIPFALVQTAGALAWGYGVRALCFGRSLSRYFALHILVALACTATASPILVFLFPSDGGHNSQIALINSIHKVVESFAGSVFSANLFYSVIDKLIAGFAALPVLGMIHAHYPIPGLGLAGPGTTLAQAGRSISATAAG
jgi:energy-coupling factor transport system substrate-specific component